MAKQQDMLLTSEGIKNYESELEYLKAVVRKEVAEKIGISQSYISRLEKRVIEDLKKEFSA